MFVASLVIVHVSSAIVPQSLYGERVERVKSTEIPLYENAVGLISVYLLQRPFVAYVELLMFSVWDSEHALRQFTESQPLGAAVQSGQGIIQLEPHTFELVVAREGKRQQSDDPDSTRL